MPSSILTLWTIVAVAVMSLTFACASEPSPTVQSPAGAPVPSATLITTVSPTVQATIPQATIPARTTTAQTGTTIAATTSVSTPTPAPTPTRTDGRYPGGSPLEVALIEEWIIAYINEAREAQGFHPLESDPVISDIARDHSASITATGIFSTQINGDGPIAPWPQDTTAGRT